MPALNAFYPAPEPTQRRPTVGIPTGGSQPPRSTPGAFALVAQWWAKAQIPEPVQGTRVIMPLTLTYGQQPPRIAPMPKVQEQVARAWWPSDGEPRLVAPLPRHESDMVPLTLAYGQQPPLFTGLPLEEMETILLTPSLDWPAQSGPRIVALTLPTGQQPPRRTVDLSAILSWAAVDWGTQTEGENAAWNAAPLASLVAFRRDAAFAPPDMWPAQRARTVAPLALAYGQQPPPNLEVPVFWIPPDWTPPPLAPIAAVISGSVLLGGTPLALCVMPSNSWPAPDWLAQTARPIALATLLPPAPYLPYRRDSVPWLPQDWLAQAVPPVAPLSLRYGDRPPTWSWLAGPTILGTWVPSWPAQAGARGAPIYGQQPPPPRARPAAPALLWPWSLDWQAQSEADGAAWNGVIVAPPYVPFRRSLILWPPADWPWQARQLCAAWNLVLLAGPDIFVRITGIAGIDGHIGGIGAGRSVIIAPSGAASGFANPKGVP